MNQKYNQGITLCLTKVQGPSLYKITHKLIESIIMQQKVHIFYFIRKTCACTCTCFMKRADLCKPTANQVYNL